VRRDLDGAVAGPQAERDRSGLANTWRSMNHESAPPPREGQPAAVRPRTKEKAGRADRRQRLRSLNASHPNAGL
jgi:hypothetical protein